MLTENTHLNDLLQRYDLTALIKEPICYQSQNPNCIDHCLTNQKALFKHCQTYIHHFPNIAIIVTFTKNTLIFREHIVKIKLHMVIYLAPSSSLNYENLINKLCKKPKQRLNALTTITYFFGCSTLKTM